jgi:hypothetical protein
VAKMPQRGRELLERANAAPPPLERDYGKHQPARAVSKLRPLSPDLCGGHVLEKVGWGGTGHWWQLMSSKRGHRRRCTFQPHPPVCWPVRLTIAGLHGLDTSGSLRTMAGSSAGRAKSRSGVLVSYRCTSVRVYLNPEYFSPFLPEMRHIG